MLTWHLHALEVPINRIGCRDFAGKDKDRFIKHWRRLTDNRDLRHAFDPEYLEDMLFGWVVFTKWESNEELQMVENRLGQVFDDLDSWLKALHGQE
jgi:hypothetical protein